MAVNTRWAIDSWFPSANSINQAPFLSVASELKFFIIGEFSKNYLIIRNPSNPGIRIFIFWFYFVCVWRTKHFTVEFTEWNESNLGGVGGSHNGSTLVILTTFVGILWCDANRCIPFSYVKTSAAITWIAMKPIVIPKRVTIPGGLFFNKVGGQLPRGRSV